jgi:hypothetical protein
MERSEGLLHEGSKNIEEVQNMLEKLEEKLGDWKEKNQA